jgi:hypothetical protein
MIHDMNMRLANSKESGNKVSLLNFSDVFFFCAGGKRFSYLSLCHTVGQRDWKTLKSH